MKRIYSFDLPNDADELAVYDRAPALWRSLSGMRADLRARVLTPIEPKASPQLLTWADVKSWFDRHTKDISW